jgi:hypothetical protein
MNAAAEYSKVVERLVRRRGVTQGGRGFGASALKVDGKIFAMLSAQGRFVVKLPRERVTALLASGDRDRFDPGHGRVMKEWVALKPVSRKQWMPLAEEAMQFVRSKSR